MAKKCLKCGGALSSRRKTTKLCRPCDIKRRSENKHGRLLPNCKNCGKKLSTVKNKTMLCKQCEPKFRIQPAIKIYRPPWNKGKSMFKSKEEYIIHRNKKRKELRKSQLIQEKFADRIRTLIRNQIKKYSNRRKNTKTEILLGCDCNFFRKYLENLFHDNMNWDNYGNGYDKWNIDHILPVSSFDLTKPEQQKKAFHFTNCRPMWSIDNIKKGNKII